MPNTLTLRRWLGLNTNEPTPPPPSPDTIGSPAFDQYEPGLAIEAQQMAR